MARSAYELFYWPTIPGRGEFVRLALEYACAPYVDVAREPRAGGMAAMMRLLNDAKAKRPPFAPPFLRHGSLVIAQTANILQYVAPRHGLVPASVASATFAHQLQLTIADLVVEAHDAHHPIGGNFYYEEQKREAKRRAEDFRAERIPKFLGYFERVLANGDGRHLVGRSTTYVDLSAFQVVAGLSYAFPNAMKALRRKVPRLLALHDRIAECPELAAYFASPRRLAFNQEGIFRHYPELDAPKAGAR